MQDATRWLGARRRGELEALIGAAYARCHPGETLDDLKRRAVFSKEDKGLLRDWLMAAMAWQRACAPAPADRPAAAQRAGGGEAAATARTRSPASPAHPETGPHHETGPHVETEPRERSYDGTQREHRATG